VRVNAGVAGGTVEIPVVANTGRSPLAKLYWF
jgi:hypothetical protein